VTGWLAQYRPATAAAYTADLKAWVHWAVARGLTLATAGPADIGAWARHLETAGARPAGVARKLATLSSFYRWALAQDAIARNPLDRVRRPCVVDDAQPLGLDRDQAARLLDAADKAGPRDHALICLLLLNGLRVSEACAARIDDLGASRGHVTLRIRRKAGREATIPLDGPTAAAVTAIVGDRTTGRLLLDAAGRPLDRHDAARIVARLARRSELPATHPHALRHTFVTYQFGRRRVTTRRPKTPPGTPTHAPPAATIGPATTSTATPPTPSPPAPPPPHVSTELPLLRSRVN
jgi:integrase/recombinase XerD